MKSQLLWYTARSSGIVAWALVNAGVLWGLVLSTKLLGKRPRPNWVLDLHRILGGAAVVFTGIHVASIVLDSYVHFGLVDVLVPLASSSHPVAVAWGIVALYLVLAVEVTSLRASSSRSACGAPRTSRAFRSSRSRRRTRSRPGPTAPRS